MGRDSRRTRAIKRAKRNDNGTFGTAAADSDDDMDIVLEFVDDIVVSEQDIQDYYPQVQRMKRGYTVGMRLGRSAKKWPN
jgi:hypothetical protein